MKTVMIWDECGQEPIRYVVLEGDFRKFDRVYVNTYTKDKKEQELQRELCALVYDEHTGEKLHEMTEEFPVNAVSRDYAFVIVAGFLP